MGDTGTGLRALRTFLARRLEIRGRCICGVLALETHRRGARVLDLPIELSPLGERRGIAWYHQEQVFWLILEIWKHVGRRRNHDTEDGET